jgi:hypothetical protein
MDALKRRLNCPHGGKSLGCKQSLSRHIIVQHDHYQRPGPDVQPETVTTYSEQIPDRVPTRPAKVCSKMPRLLKNSKVSAKQAFQMTRATAERVTNSVPLTPEELLNYVKQQPLLPGTALAETIGGEFRWDQATVRRHAQRIQDQRAARYELLRKLRGE